MIGIEMNKIIKFFHLYGAKRKLYLFLVNKVFVGATHFERKRKLLNSIGFEIGKNTKIVGPVECYGVLKIGENCWIGKNLRVNGNGTVIIGNNCDIAPEVTFQTGGHLIGTPERRAGKGQIYNQSVGDGTWIGGRVTILNETNMGKACVIAGCACVTQDVGDYTLVGGVPAKIIRSLKDD